MQEYADLEIGIHRHDDQSYRLEPRLLLPDDEGERRPPGSLTTSFDFQELDTLLNVDDLEAYGKKLGQALFKDGVQTLLTLGRTGLSQNPPIPLRLRLHIGPSAPELHRLRWEALRDPQEPDIWLASDIREPFSRYLSSYDWRPVHLRPRGRLSALVVIANPAPRPGDNLDPIDAPAELTRARAALQDVDVKILCSGPGLDSDPDRIGRPTLSALIAALDQNFDILYLVCHGKLINGVPKVWLEDDDGKVDVVSAEEDPLPAGGTRPGLVMQLTSVLHLPRLVVLASCQSAGTGATTDSGVLSAMGPRLVEAGIPAVIAMQGNVTMVSVEKFMPRFFEIVREEGLVDLAVAAARKDLINAGRTDWWMPVVYMRLRTGRIWYDPGFAGNNPDFETWPDLTQAIKDRRCTPIIGPGMLEFLYGSPSELAQKWSDTQHFPMAPFYRTDLPRVARYLATIQSPTFPIGQFREYLKEELWRRHTDKLQDLPKDDCPLPKLIQQVGKCARQVDEKDPFRVLAAMPVEIYLTTTPDDLLFDALKEAGKDPQVALRPWNETIEQPNSAFEADPSYRPSVNKPLIYYLFGHLEQPDSLVLSEDDYFNYLIWSITDQNRMEPLTPPVVSKALTKNALLFLGFQIDDWDFRVLFHSISNPQGGQLRRPMSVAVQVGPDEGRFIQPRQARKYLEKYYSGFRVRTNVFWGTGPDFVRQVWDRRDKWE